MRTTIVINDELIAKVMQLSKLNTKQEVVDQALKHFVGYLKRKNVSNLFGKIAWEGNLTNMREI